MRRKVRIQVRVSITNADVNASVRKRRIFVFLVLSFVMCELHERMRKQLESDES